MFNWLKPKIDLTKEEQIQELKESYGHHPMGELFLSQVMSGLDCDELPNASGPFGSMKNPIPVNGSRGEFMYLQRIHCSCGTGIMFHRLGSTKLGTEQGTMALDIFETVCIDGKHWEILFLDMYHPRRSLKTPAGYTNARYDKTFSRLPIAWGTTQKVDHFPLDLPKCIAQQIGPGIGDAVGRRCKEAIGSGKNFIPPQSHVERRQNYIEAIKGNAAIGIVQAVADMGETKPEKTIFF